MGISFTQNRGCHIIHPPSPVRAIFYSVGREDYVIRKYNPSPVGATLYSVVREGYVPRQGAIIQRSLSGLRRLYGLQNNEISAINPIKKTGHL